MFLTNCLTSAILLHGIPLPFCSSNHTGVHNLYPDILKEAGKYSGEGIELQTGFKLKERTKSEERSHNAPPPPPQLKEVAFPYCYPSFPGRDEQSSLFFLPSWAAFTLIPGCTWQKILNMDVEPTVAYKMSQRIFLEARLSWNRKIPFIS